MRRSTEALPSTNSILKKEIMTPEYIEHLRQSNHRDLDMKQSARIRRILRKNPPHWNVYFTKSNLRLIQVLKNRRLDGSNKNVRGADEGVQGFKGVDWLQNVFNPYAKNMLNSNLNESILTYKKKLSPITGLNSSGLDLENDASYDHAASITYQGYSIA